VLLTHFVKPDIPKIFSGILPVKVSGGKKIKFKNRAFSYSSGCEHCATCIAMFVNISSQRKIKKVGNSRWLT
jgi:hypothetical protein